MSYTLPLLLSLLVVVTGCTQQAAIPLQIQASAQLPAIAAEFSTTITESDHDTAQEEHVWRFWRGAHFIENLNLQDQSGENWSLSTDGTITYQRLFHSQQQLIDYLPGDLKAIGTEPNWQALGTLLSPAMVATLLADGQKQVLGRTAIHYHSTDPNQDLEVLWLEQEQLPALLKYNDHGHTFVTRLTALYPLAQSPWTYQRASSYRSTDFSDLGDKENDPFVKSIQHKIKGAHNHAH